MVLTSVPGCKAEKIIKLKDIDPCFERSKRVLFSLIIIPAIMVVLMFWAVIKIMQQQTVSQTLVVAPSIVLVISLWHVVAGTRPIEITIFRNKSGAALIEVYRPKGRNIAYEEFIAAAAERIKATRALDIGNR